MIGLTGLGGGSFFAIADGTGTDSGCAGLDLSMTAGEGVTGREEGRDCRSILIDCSSLVRLTNTPSSDLGMVSIQGPTAIVGLVLPAIGFRTTTEPASLLPLPAARLSNLERSEEIDTGASSS